MVFAKLSAILALAILAAATPALAQDCDTGAIQCCQSVEPASSATAADLLSSIGVVLQDVNVPIGITCTPISVIGVGGSDACSANAVCCENNSFGGLLAIGCLPVSA